jgi:assimilatory nitrate reductase catalytic subunit
MQCGMTLKVESGLWSVLGRDFPTNKGGLSRKGWTVADPLNGSDRLKTRLLRESKGSALRPCRWDEAFDFICGRIVGLQIRFGRDSIALFVGGGLTNEKAYMLCKFAHVGLRTKNVDNNGFYCMASTVRFERCTPPLHAPDSFGMVFHQ